jgi:hypothetical protein
MAMQHRPHRAGGDTVAQRGQRPHCRFTLFSGRAVVYPCHK